MILKKRGPSSKLGATRNIVLEGIVSHAQGTSILQGVPEQPLENIRISGLQTFMEPETTVDKRATDAVYAEEVRGLYLQDVAIFWENAEREWRNALCLKDVSNFVIDGFSGRQGGSRQAAAILLESISHGVIRNSTATDACGTFLEIRGRTSHGLRLADNDTSKAVRAVTFVDGAIPGRAISGERKDDVLLPAAASRKDIY